MRYSAYTMHEGGSCCYQEFSETSFRASGNSTREKLSRLLTLTREQSSQIRLSVWNPSHEGYAMISPRVRHYVSARALSYSINVRRHLPRWVDRRLLPQTFFRFDPAIRRGEKGNLRKSLALNRTEPVLRLDNVRERVRVADVRKRVRRVGATYAL